jgi:hypothetical protein
MYSLKVLHLKAADVLGLPVCEQLHCNNLVVSRVPTESGTSNGVPPAHWGVLSTSI